MGRNLKAVRDKIKIQDVIFIIDKVFVGDKSFNTQWIVLSPQPRPHRFYIVIDSLSIDPYHYQLDQENEF